MNYADEIQLGLLALTAVGLFLNLLQNRAANRQKSAENIVSLVQHFSSDKDIVEARYDIEYDQFKYNDSFHDSPLEKKIDKLLDHYDTVARLCLSSQLKIKDLEFMAYDILTVYQNAEIQKYLTFLDDWVLKRGITTQQFASFRKVGAVLEKRHSIQPKALRVL